MIRRFAVAAGLLPLLPVFPCSAEETLNPVIVTATRTAQTADDSLASVTVITRRDIERRQAQTLQDVLQGVPGLELANSGGRGEATSVFLRGTNADHVLVLIDGIKVGSPTLGTTPFQYIPVDQIQRIEIVRGPRSSLYGSQAIGGVIQIFTRKGGGPLTPTFSAGAGNYQTNHLSAGVSGGSKHGWFNLTASRFDTGGINACQGSLTAGCFTIEPDKDGYLNVSESARAGYRFSGGNSVDVHLLRAQGHNQFDGTTSNQTDFVNQTIGGRLRVSPLDPWYATLTVGVNQDHQRNLLDSAFASRFNTARDNLVFQNDVSIGAHHLLTLGFSYRNDKVSSSVDYSETSRDDKGTFIQYQGAFGRQNIQIAARHDINQQFGGYNTGSIAWGYKLTKGLRLTASYGTAFKAPTFNDLYFPGFGNPALRPERSRSAEVDIKGRPHWGSWSVNLYQTKIHELIAFDPNTFAPANIDAARIRGLEAIIATRLMGWNIHANATLLRPENRGAGPDHGNLLPRRAEEQFRLSLYRHLGKLELGASYFYQGGRYNDLANTRRLGGYSLVGLRAEYALTDSWRLQARVSNLLDKHYETAAFYNQLGRNFMFTLRYHPLST